MHLTYLKFAKLDWVWRELAQASCILLILGSGFSAKAEDQIQAFVDHLDEIAPGLLSEASVPGAAVALIEDGKVVFIKGYGVASVETGKPITGKTVFNAGSISKLATAWGVMALVEKDLLDLDRPVGDYLSEWEPQSDGFDFREITPRMLLTHTGGLSMSAVPAYGPDDAIPSLEDALIDVRVEALPGESFSYSGGGYMLLQLVIENITGQSFSDYMRNEVFLPLGLENTDFQWRSEMRAQAATPYDGEAPDVAPYFTYVGEAAASLNATATDLANILIAELGGTKQKILSAQMLDEMRSIQPATQGQFGTHYGFGHDIWGLAGGKLLVGHNGQNTGWGSAAWFAPHLNAGIVILTNHSDGRQAWKWILCDWVKWKADTVWPGMCDVRPDFLAAPIEFASDKEALAAPNGSSSPAIDRVVEGSKNSTFVGAGIAVSDDSEIIHSGGYGMAEIEADRKVDGDTAFYLASVSKPITATAVMQLVESGEIGLDDAVGPSLPELPDAFHGVTVRQLLSHTSGIPGYWQHFSYREVGRLSNDQVFDVLTEHPELDFEPGSKYSYSNSGYVILGRLIERLSGLSYRDYLSEKIFGPAGMRGAAVYDVVGRELPVRAMGYRGDGVPFDYVDIRQPDGSTSPVRITTTGSGGIYASAADIVRFADALIAGKLVSRESLMEMFTAQAGFADEDVQTHGRSAYGLGWEIGVQDGRKVLSHNGGMVGFSTLLLIVPGQKLSVAVLSNSSEFDSDSLAFKIARQYRDE